MKYNLKLSNTAISHIIAIIVIWFIFPYFSFIDVNIFSSETIRIIAILIYFIIFYVIKAHRDYKLDFMAKDIEAKGYLSKFSEILKELIHSQTNTYKFFKGRGLYKKPWFLVVGAENSGNSTVIKSFGLDFDVKHCETVSNRNKPTLDWYSSKESVLIDMNSKLLSLDSPEDNTLFDETLDLVTRIRPLKPLNGIILTINAEVFLNNNPQIFERELNKYKILLKKVYTSGIKNIPVYLLISNMDKVPGFAEYFDHKTFDTVNQVLGITLPLSNISNPIEWINDQYINILNNVNNSSLTSLRKKISKIDSEKTFYFGRYLAFIKEQLNLYLESVIYENNYSKSLSLRGIYFTAVKTDQVHHFDNEKADIYFLKNVYRKVVMKEAQKLSRFDSFIYFLSKHKNYVYSISGVVAVGLVTSWIVGYTKASSYLAKIRHTNNTLQPLLNEVNYSQDYWVKLQKLDSMAKLKEKEYSSWHHFGLSFPIKTDIASWGNYNLELEKTFKPYLIGEIRENIRTLIKQINALDSSQTSDKNKKLSKLYNWLMMYMMFNKTTHLKTKFIKSNLSEYWKQLYKNDEKTEMRLNSYLNDLLNLPTDKLYSNIDSSLAKQAQSVLGGDIYIYRAYEQFKHKAMVELESRPFILGGVKNVNILNQPVTINYAYTIEGWNDYSKEELAKQLKIAQKDQWAFDPDSISNKYDASKSLQRIYGLYWDDYAAKWLEALNLIEFKQMTLEQRYSNTQTTSDIQKMFERVMLELKQNITTEVMAAITGDNKSSMQKVIEFINSEYKVKTLEEKIVSLEKLIRIMSSDENIRQQQGFELSKLIASDKQRVFESLKTFMNTSPEAINSIIKSYMKSFAFSVFSAAADYDLRIWNTELSGYCSNNLADNYPFANSRNEMSLSTFEKTLESSSVLMKYFSSNIAPFVTIKNSGELQLVSIYGAKVPFDKGLFKELNMLSQINFLTKGSEIAINPNKLGMVINFTPVILSSNLSGIDIIYNGTNIGYYNGPQYQQKLSWPFSSNTDGTLQVIWHFRDGSERKNIFYGQWGIFKFLSKFTYDKNKGQYKLSYGQSDTYAVFKIYTDGKGTVDSIYNLENMQCKF